MLAAALLLLPALGTAQPERPPAKVGVTEVTRRPFTPRIEILGETEPVRAVTLSAEVEGKVAAVAVDLGAHVEAGQELARLDAELREIAARRAEAELRIAQAQLAEYRAGSRTEEVAEAKAAVEAARANLKEAEEYLTRTEELVQTGVQSEKVLIADRARASLMRALLEQRQATYELVAAGPRQELIERAAADVAAREAALAEIRDEIARTVLRAPFAGVVTQKIVEVGQYLRAADPMLSLVQLEPIRVTLAVPERGIGGIAKGTAIAVRFDAFGGAEMRGEVESIVPVADPLARTLPVRVLLPNGDGRLMVGMTARADVPLSEQRLALSVPTDAIVQTYAGPAVFVVREGVAVQVPVQLGAQSEGLVEVRGELSEGDRVAVLGNEGLRAGQRVEIVETPPAVAPQDGERR